MSNPGQVIAAENEQNAGMTSPGDARVVTVSIVHEVFRGPIRETAIDKRPVNGPVGVGKSGLAGDIQCDTRYHGGPDKAVYAYAAEDSAWWSGELGRQITPGLFGENLTTAGLDVTGAVIGERWLIGTDGVLLEVRMPRTPCANLSARMEIPRFHRRFAASGRTGALLKVLTPGRVAAGAPSRAPRHPAHGVTIGELAIGPTAEQMRLLVDSDPDLAAAVRSQARRVLARADR
jgi:MOSC domain-containing protein YiiM